MVAIFKRELSSYFTAPIGYVFIALFFLFSGAFFYMFTLSAGSADLSMVFLGMFFVLMIFVPVLTMRLMSEDKKQKSDQLALTAPVSLFGIVMGKFLAAYCIFVISALILLVYALVLSIFATVAWAVVIGNLVGLLLLGGLYVAIGLLISTLTENQMIAAIGSISVNLCLFLMDTLAYNIPIPFVGQLLNSISVYSRYAKFTTGIFDISSVVFFLSAIAIFLFLTVKALERKRWA